MLGPTEFAGDTVSLTRDGDIAILRLERARSRNALNRALVADIAAACRAIDADPGIRAVVVCADGPTFCAGLDRNEPYLADIRLLERDGFGDREAIARLRQPVIAAVQGAAIGGGCELALMCDLVVAATTATFRLPEVTMGSMPGAGGTQRLAWLVGPMRAREICLTGRPVPAAEALTLGLAIEVVDPRVLMTRAMELACLIAMNPAIATRSIKLALRATENLGLDQGLLVERQLSYQCIAARRDEARSFNQNGT